MGVRRGDGRRTDVRKRGLRRAPGVRRSPQAVQARERRVDYPGEPSIGLEAPDGVERWIKEELDEQRFVGLDELVEGGGQPCFSKPGRGKLAGRSLCGGQ